MNYCLPGCCADVRGIKQKIILVSAHAAEFLGKLKGQKYQLVVGLEEIRGLAAFFLQLKSTFILGYILCG